MSMRPVVIALFVTALALAAEPATLPDALAVPSGKLAVELALDTTWKSDDHRLRSLSDEAYLSAKLDVVAGSAGALDATPRLLHVTRRKQAHISGFFSDDDKDEKGRAHYDGSGPAPPAWHMIVSARGTAVADLTSAKPVWHLEAWFHGFDEHNDEEARLRRLVHYTDVGFFGAPPLTAGEHFEYVMPFVAGESGLSNKLADLEAVFDLSVTREDGLLRVSGPLAKLRLIHGEGPGSKRVDQWIDVAFARGGPAAKGSLEATFDPAKRSWREVSSEIAFEHKGKFDGGSGRATFERRFKASWEY